MRSSHCARATAGNRSHRQSSTVGHAPGGNCSVLAASPSMLGGRKRMLEVYPLAIGVILEV